MSDLFGIGAGIASSISNGIIAGKNLEAQREANAQNLKLARESFEYQKQLNNLTMQREDNAVQRRAMDLEKAGLSKVLAAGSAAGSANYASGSLGQVNPTSYNGDPLGAMFGMLENVERLKNVNMNNVLAQQQHAMNGVRIQSELANIDKIYAEIEAIRKDANLTSTQEKREATKHAYEQANHGMPIDMLTMNYKGIPAFALATQAGDNLNMLGNKIINGATKGIETVFDKVKGGFNKFKEGAKNVAKKFGFFK